jgi:hypothetical protein
VLPQAAQPQHISLYIAAAGGGKVAQGVN